MSVSKERRLEIGEQVVMSDKSMESEVSGEAMVVRIVEPARELEHLL